MRLVPLDMLPQELQQGVSQQAPVPLDMLPPELGGLEPKPETSGVLRQTADIPVGIAKGVTSGIRMLTDIFGANNPVSQALQGTEGYLNSLMSAQAKNNQKEIFRILEEAKDKGALEEVLAAVKAFGTAPVDFMSQAAGTAIPVIAGGLAGAVAKIAPRIIGAGIGAGMGTGVVKGTIYEETKKALLDAKVPEDQAEARAQLAQSYGGENLDMILGGAALGGLGAVTGVEKALVGPLSRKILGKAAAEETGEQAAKGVVRRTLGTAGAEAVPEFAQASQEQLAANLAVQREGLERDLMSGVIGAGTLEALAGAGLGAGVGAVSRGAAPEVDKRVPLENLSEEIRKQTETQMQDRLDQLERKATGTPAQETTVDGKKVVIPEVLPEFLTDEELAERNQLRSNLGIETKKPEVTAPKTEDQMRIRLDQLEKKATGTPEQETTINGKKVVIPGTMPEYLTNQELAERDNLRSSLNIVKAEPEITQQKIEAELTPPVSPPLSMAPAAQIAPSVTTEVTPIEPIPTEMPETEITPEFVSGTPTTGEALPAPDYIQRTEADIQRAVKQMQEIEGVKPTPSTSLYEFFAYRPKKDKEGKTLPVEDNRLDMKEVLDVSPDKTFNFIRKKGGKSISDFIRSQQMNPWLPFELRFYGDENADEISEKESLAEEHIKDALRARNYLTYESQVELDRISQDLNSLERSLEEDLAEYDTDENRRQTINDLLSEINQSLETEPPPADLVEAPPARAERGAGEPIGEVGPEVKSLTEIKTGQPFSYQGFRGAGKTAEEIYTGAKVPVAGKARYIASNREDASKFGEQITEEPVILANPLVIRTDDEWRSLTRKAGWKFPNPFMQSESEVQKSTASLSKMIQDAGYDGLVIDPSKEGDAAKTLWNVFGMPQIVDYKGDRKLQVKEPSSEDRRRADMERDLFRLSPEGQFAPTTGVQGDMFGATGQLAPTPQLQRRKNENIRQLSLFLDSDPDPSQQNSQAARQNAVEAVEQLQESNNPMAMNLADELANRQQTLLVGKKATSVEDMAVLAQVYRDPRFETFRVFFTDKDGNIVSQIGLTSRMPASSVAMIGDNVSSYADSVMNTALEKGATGYFLVHNHPSGIVEASNSDKILTRSYAERFNQLQYKGHVIIDTNKYGVVEASGKSYEVEKDLGEKPFPGQMGEMGKIRSLSDVANITKQMELSEDDVVLLVLNSQGNVLQISTLPATVAKDTNKFRLRRNLQKVVLQARGADLIVVGQNSKILDGFIGMVKDRVEVSANGEVKSSLNIGRKILGGDRRGRVAAATSPEFNYLKKLGAQSAPTIEAAEPGIDDNPNTYNTRQNIFGQSVEASWGRQDESKLDTFIYILQDKMIDTKRVIEQIKKTGKEISDRWNTYLREELFHGRAAKKTKDFLTFELDPLMKEMNKRGVTMAEFEEYLHNRTAKERNDLVATRDPEKFPDGGSGILTEDAQNYMANLSSKKRADYEALAKMVDGITKGTRNLLVESGHESPETIAAWEKALPNYVPLNRAETDYELRNMGTGVGQGYGIRGAFARPVVGSQRPVVDILANIAMQRERAIVRTEKMRVGQALYGLVLQNPNPNFWLAVDPEAEANPDDIEAIARTLKSMGFDEGSPELSSIMDLADAIMKQPTIRKLNTSENAVVLRANHALRNSPFAIPIRIDGVDKYVFFNPNDPLSARMAKALRNIDADQMDKVLDPIAKVTRYFASINTQYNPIFGAINFMRDVQGAMIQLTSTPLAGKQKEVAAQTIPALRGIYADLRARRDGKEAKGKWVDLWNQFQDLGGQTGFRDQFSRSSERADALYSVMNPESWTETKLGKIFTANGALKVPLEAARKSIAKPLFDWLSDYNETMENAVRLAAFKTALDSGMSPDQAASLAKNLTVNFNRKGLIGKQAGALYAFFNASVQGTARMARTIIRRKDGKVELTPAGKMVFYGGLLLGSAQALLLAAAGFDEKEPPEYIKERNLVIPVGGGKYITIPFPLGYNVIPNTSRVMTEWALSGFKDTPKRVASITGAFAEMFNPIGNAGWSWQTFSPTIADPAVALFENRDWTGKPIAKQDISNLDPTPGYTRARDTASWFSKNISEFLNLASGGTEFKKGLFSPTPDQIDYLIGQATGGVGREIMKAEQTIRSSITGEELPTYKIPLVGRFVGDVTGQAAVRDRFYNNIVELNAHQREIQGRQKSGQSVQEYIRENPEARLYKMADKVQTNVQKLRKRREMLVEKNAPKEQVKAIENQITAQMKRLNDAVSRLEE